MKWRFSGMNGLTIRTFAYDALGRRVQKHSPTAHGGSPGQVYFYDGNRVVHMEEYGEKTSTWCPPMGCGGSQKAVSQKETFEEPVVEHTLDMDALFDEYGDKIMTQMFCPCGTMY